MIEHPIPPLFDGNSKILILGSFPSVKSRDEKFFYAHPQNRFWRVLAAVYGEDVPETVEDKKHLLLSHNIALWDVIASCEIKGSSDSSIKNVVPNELSGVLATTKIERIFVNGKTAEKYYKRYQEKRCGMSAILLPSTSPANAAIGFDKLVSIWRGELLFDGEKI